MWDKLKKILETSNERAVIVEDGEPSYVILSVNEYLRLTQNGQSSVPEQVSAPDKVSQNTAGEGGAQDWNQGNSVNQGIQNEPASGPIGGGASAINAESAPIDLSDINYNDNANNLENNYSIREASAGINLEDLPV